MVGSRRSFWSAITRQRAASLYARYAIPGSVSPSLTVCVRVWSDVIRLSSVSCSRSVRYSRNVSPTTHRSGTPSGSNSVYRRLTVSTTASNVGDGDSLSLVVAPGKDWLHVTRTSGGVCRSPLIFTNR